MTTHASRTFTNRTTVPTRYTCDGEDISPPLDWAGAPPAARSFVILCDDPDAPAGTWHHWAAYDIPSDQTELPEGAAQNNANRFKQAINDFRRRGYGGPCPPRGHGPHHYRFHLLALEVKHLSVSRNATCRDVELAARKHKIAEATLVGLYER